MSDLLREVAAAVRPGAYSPQNEEAGRRVAAAAAAAEAAAARRSWRNGDLELLNGTWELVFTSNGDVDRGDARQLLGDVASSFGGFQPLKLESVRQEIDVQAGRLRNRLSLAPWPTGLPLPPPLGTLLSELQDAEVILSLDHRFEAYGDARIRIVLERLDRSLRRRSGQELEGLASWLPLDSSYAFPQLLGEMGPGRFDTTLLEGDVRISRGAAPFRELRIFRRLRR